ncbi:protein artemis-like [Sycon ciliatum]|uniref:protein artemis-like n=1 Tax=Sycon ciliatum TaxID=27933 RepID=UPI0031F6E35E
MSSFDGVVREYGGVIIDQFCSTNCRRGRAFFLSHCHKDHMTNLSSTELSSTLRSGGGAQGLYCSRTTRDLLQADPDFEHLRGYLVGLPVDEPIPMNYIYTDGSDENGKPGEIEFTVTLIPAGHCPGSTMFLFEGTHGNVLYTGDFRLAVGDSARLSALQTCSGSAKDFAAVYLDTTFCHPAVPRLPCRSLTRAVVLSAVERWLAQGESHYVVVRAPTFGYEHVWVALHERFGMPIHVSDRVLGYYTKSLSEVAQCLTSDASVTRLHSCRWDSSITTSYRSHLPCGHVPSCGAGKPSIMHVKMSVMSFVRGNCIPESGVVEHAHGIHAVHSMHASYDEARDLVTFLSPRRVQACVHPAGPKSSHGSTMRDAENFFKDLLHDNGERSPVKDAEELVISTACLKRQASWPSSKPLAATDNCPRPIDPGPEGSTTQSTTAEAVSVLSRLSEGGDDDDERALPLPPKRRRRG